MAKRADIGQRICDLRTSAGRNQKELAALSGLKPNRICKIELGRSKPYFWEVLEIAKGLDLPLEHFDPRLALEVRILVVPRTASDEVRAQQRSAHG